MAALGQQLFSKELTMTDVVHRLHWLAEYLSELPSFNGGHQVDFTAKDIDGRVWEFRCSTGGFFLCDKKKPMLKWTFILLNVGLELCQATFSQEAGDGKMKGSQYRKLAFIFSAICLTLSLVELLQEGWTEGVEWTKNRGWYWFHYPGEDGPIFGKFSQWFGLASVLVQFSLNLVSLVIKRGVLKFDILGPLLSWGYFILALLGERTAMGAKVRCNFHGTNEAEAELVQGTWVFTCHKCLQRPHEI